MSNINDLIDEDQKKPFAKNAAVSKEHKEQAYNALKNGNSERARMHYTASVKSDPNIKTTDVDRIVKDILRTESKNLICARYKKWRDESAGSPQEHYDRALLAVRELYYELEDVAEFLQVRMEEWEFEHCSRLGIFLSALTNQVIKSGETLTLNVRNYTDFIGAFHEKGILVVHSMDGPHNYYWWNFGYGMLGGKVVIKDGPGKGYGNHMVGGELVIEGEIVDEGLAYVEGGHAILHAFADRNRTWGVDIELGKSQSEGLIEILCDIHSGIQYLSREQTGGELRVHKDVACENIGYGKKGGKTVVGSVLGKGWCQGIIGEFMESGEIIVEGNAGCTERKALVGFRQKGGNILIKGDVYCSSLGQDSWPGSTIEVKGNVYGSVGDRETAGIKIFIGGDVHGDVGDGTWDMECTIKGSVYGNVGNYFGRQHEKDRKRNGKIEIFGDVHGDVGNNMYKKSEVIVHGNVYGAVCELCGGIVKVDGSIREVCPVQIGKVYRGGRDITKTNKSLAVLRFFFGPLHGEK